MTSELENTGKGIDWAQPWWASVRKVGQRCLAHAADQAWTEGGCAAALNQVAAEVGMTAAASVRPVRFVAQAQLPAGDAYEAFIARTRQVPTRDNLHDFFNGLVWQRWPRTKAQLNVLQASEIARDGISTRRGPVRDAITVWDENGALLLAPPVLWEALLHRNWMCLFVTHRALWQHARLVLFGHALMEQLVRPRKNLTAHVLVLPQLSTALGTDALAALDAGDTKVWADWDHAVASHLTADWLATKPLTPLPVLGIPGWCSDNETPAFYEDVQVFRQVLGALSCWSKQTGERMFGP